MSAPGSPACAGTVLVVDDDETTRAWADAHLGARGFRILEAADGEQALALLVEQSVDVVLLDVEMPGRDGFEVCACIREEPGLATLPVVMVTGLEDQASIDRAYACGATDFVTKPINWPLLGHRLPYVIRSGSSASALARSQQLLSAAQEMALLGSWVLETENEEVTWSDELYRRLGHAPGSVPASMEAMRARVPDDQAPALDDAIARVREAGGSEELVHDVLSPDGRLRTVRHVPDGGGKAPAAEVRGIVLDVSEQLAAQQKIHRLAYVDSLTGLPNRARFNEVLAGEMERARRSEASLAVLFLDLDNFKRVNDTLGHAVGDRLLEEVSGRLRRTLRCYDTVGTPGDDDSVVARLGGDEFTVLLPAVAGGRDAARVAERIIATLAEPMRPGGHEVYVTPSIGIAVFPDNGRDADTLLRHADAAMYHAKSQGKNAFCFFDASMDATMQRRLKLEAELRKALERGEISVHYQPQLDLESARVVGVEALARWHSAELGSVAPAEFIPVAEETGLIDRIGAWVMECACSDAVEWQGAGIDVRRVAVNVSPVQFMQPDFARGVRDILRRTGLPPQCLDIEITERVVMRDLPAAVRVLDELKVEGVQISVDDFGTGCSSLAQMRHLPIDRLKIDQSFVQQITSSPEDAAITSAVIAMAESMSLDVVAEGVETEAQLSFLVRRQCKAAQGFHVSRPMRATDLQSFLRNHAELATVRSPAAGGRRTVLVVDDDAFSRELVRGLLQGGGFTVHEAADAEEAFSLLACHEVDVVVADQVMPGMLGTEFLARVRKLSPRAVRILLSGESDREDLLSAINDSAVFRFVEKADATTRLREVVEEGLEARRGGLLAREGRPWPGAAAG